MVSVDVGAFLSRIERLYADWEVSKEEIERELFISDPCFLQSEEDTNLWNEVDCVAVVVGRDEEVVYAKSMALQVRKRERPAN